MKIFLLLVSITFVSAAENFLGPEWKPIDLSEVVSLDEAHEFWKGTIYKKAIENVKPKMRRIIGGEEVVPHSHPHSTYLLLQMSASISRCGGTVISPTVILTAAHCLIIAPVSGGTAVVGGHNVHIVEATQQRRSFLPSAFRTHPGWDSWYVLNDVATIILETPLVFNQYVQPIVLAEVNAPSFVGFSTFVTGWGRTANDAPTSAVLRGVENKVLANSICEEIYGAPAINEHTICIETIGGRGVCSGDSGGPLTVIYNNVRTQVGIASFVGWLGCDVSRILKSISCKF